MVYSAFLIRKGVSHLREGVSHLREGVSHLREGVSHLREGVSQFREGVSHLREVAIAWRQSVRQRPDEGPSFNLRLRGDQKS